MQPLFAALILAPVFSPSMADMDAYIAKAMRQRGVPGLSVVVVKDGEVALAKGYGVRELGKAEPANERTLFAIGSTTKAFTSVLVAMLVDEGKMKWDDRVTTHLPRFQLLDPWVTREVTMRDLLSHRTGLEGADLLWYGSHHSRAEVLRRARFLKQNSGFRSGYAYSNIMYLAAGEAAAAVGGMSWDDLVKTRIFEPLGMKDSVTSVKALGGKTNVATPHLNGKPIEHVNIDNCAPAGSIYSSAHEMAEWLRFQLAEGAYNGRQLVKAESLAETKTPQTIMPIPSKSALFPDKFFSAYAMGWRLENHLGRKLAWHDGHVFGMRAFAALVPEARLGIAVLTNTSDALAIPLGYWLIDTWMQAPKDWCRLWFSDEKKDEVETFNTSKSSPSVALEKLAGTYRHEMYGDVKIVLAKGKLAFSGHEFYDGDLEHLNYNTFRDTAFDKFVTFNLDARGEVSWMDVEGFAEFHRVRE